MLRIVLIVTIFLATSYGQAKTWTSNANYATGTADPSSSAVNAPQGTLYFKADGSVYSKTDDGYTTNWTKITAGAALTALTGGVTATGPGSAAATVVSVGGSTAANVHTAELAANAATTLNTASTIVKRDASGNFVAGLATLGSGVQIATTVAQPSCAVGLRGRLWIVQGGAGVADVVQICQKDNLDAYGWVTH